MKRVMKWLLAPAVLMVGMALFGAERAEAQRWRVYYPAYRVPYVSYAYPAYYPTYYPTYYPSYYVAARPVRVRVYRPAPAVVYPTYYHVAAPVAVPYCGPYYSVW